MELKTSHSHRPYSPSRPGQSLRAMRAPGPRDKVAPPCSKARSPHGKVRHPGGKAGPHRGKDGLPDNDCRTAWNAFVRRRKLLFQPVRSSLPSAPAATVPLGVFGWSWTSGTWALQSASAPGSQGSIYTPCIPMRPSDVRRTVCGR